jgi:hypothetical protein
MTAAASSNCDAPIAVASRNFSFSAPATIFQALRSESIHRASDTSGIFAPVMLVLIF